MCNHVIFLCESEFTNPKARVRTEYIETVVTGIYYKTNVYTTDPRL